MTDLISAPADPQVDVEHPEHVVELVHQQPVVITERPVAVSTGTTVPLQLMKPARRVIAALRGMFLRSSADARPEPRHYPPRRPVFLGEAAMAREMHKL